MIDAGTYLVFRRGVDGQWGDYAGLPLFGSITLGNSEH